MDSKFSAQVPAGMEEKFKQCRELAEQVLGASVEAIFTTKAKEEGALVHAAISVTLVTMLWELQKMALEDGCPVESVESLLATINKSFDNLTSHYNEKAKQEATIQ